MGRMRAGREDVCEEAEVVCSVRMVLLWAMQELEDRVSNDEVIGEYATY